MSNLENLSQQDFIKAKQIFTEAVKLDQGLINDYVESQCEDNQQLLDAVLSLVNMHLDSGEKTITPKKTLSELINKTHNITEGQKIGKFVIEKPLGSGGMGDVYLAKRSDNEVQQKVAIKVLKNKLNQSAFERFQTEKRLLAHLEHPGIARLIDAGVTDGGMTYYVMEYVEGQSIDEYCEHKQLTVKQRLKLFMEVCDVVSYAHGNLIIHRDLKPQNILVTNKCQVKLLDFGIAKPLQQLPGMEELPQTMQGSFALTPQYAAPEQFTDGVIGTACDVYALGLLLYELLTGTLAQDLTGLSLAQMEKIITDKVFVNASKQVTQQDVNTEQFQLKSTIQLKSLLKGDIDAIINKAIKKEPQQRYKSVADLSQDIDNHLKYKPISVRGNQQAYRLKKYLRRNWLPVTASIGLITILSLSTYFISLERDKAIQEKQLAEEVSTFLVSTFKNADPTKTQGEKITAKEILEEGVRQINNQQDLKIKNKLLITMAEVYFSLGELVKSDKLLEEIVGFNDSEILVRKYLAKARILEEVRSKENYLKIIELMFQAQELVGENELLIQVYKNLANAYNKVDDHKKRIVYADKMLNLAEKVYDKESVDFALILNLYAQSITMFSDNKDLKLKLYKQAQRILEENLEENHHLIAKIRYQIGVYYTFTIKDPENAIEYVKTAYETYKKIYGEKFLKRASIENTLGVIYKQLNEFDKSLKHFQLAIEVEKKFFKNNPSKIATVEYNIAELYREKLKEYKIANTYYEKALEKQLVIKGEFHQLYIYQNLFYIKNLINLNEDSLAEVKLKKIIDFYNTNESKVEVKQNFYYFAIAKSLIATIEIKREQNCQAKKNLIQSLKNFKKSKTKDNLSEVIYANDTLKILNQKMKEKKIVCRKI